MKQNYRMIALVGACLVLLLIGLVVSLRLTAGISHAAYLEATQHLVVPTPSALAPKPAPKHS